MNNEMIKSYARNLLGQVIGAVVIVSNTTHVAVTDFKGHQIALVANALWASLVPVALRWVNKNDPAFGRVAQDAAAAVTDELAKKAK